MRLISLVAALFLSISPAQAVETHDRFGDWIVRCVDEEGGPPSCALVQRIIAAGGDFEAEVGLNPSESGGVHRLIVILLAPEGAALTLAPVFAVDEEPGQVALAWQVCARGVCRAAAVLTPEAEAMLRAGEKMIVGWRAYRAEAPTQIVMSLDGADSGLNALAKQ